MNSNIEAISSPRGLYRSPRLVHYGSLADLTGTASGSQDDGGFFQFSGVGGAPIRPPGPPSPDGDPSRSGDG